MTSEDSVQPEDAAEADAEHVELVRAETERALIRWRELLDRLANT
jgi:hypothetical protein